VTCWLGAGGSAGAGGNDLGRKPVSGEAGVTWGIAAGGLGVGGLADPAEGLGRVSASGGTGTACWLGAGTLVTAGGDDFGGGLTSGEAGATCWLGAGGFVAARGSAFGTREASDGTDWTC